MQLSDYAQALGLAQQLVPNWNQPDIERAQLQGLQAQTQLQQQQAAIGQQEQADAQTFRTDLAGLPRNPTANDYRQLAARHPRYFQQLSGAADKLEAGVRQQTVSNLAQIGAAITANTPQSLTAARNLIQRHIDADKAAGRPADEDDTALLAMLNSNDPEQVRAAGTLVHGTLAALDDKASAALYPAPRNRYGQLGNGGIFDYESGAVLREPTQAPVDALQVPIYDSNGQRVGTQLIPNGGRGGDPTPGGAAGAPPNGQPRSVRNNNPGNIVDSAFARAQPGYKGSDGRFAIFNTNEAGANAQAGLLRSYIGRGYNTVAKIVARWAPPSDGNDTAAYTRSVAQALNVNENDTLSPAIIPRLQTAMANVERGGTPNRVAPAAPGERVIGPVTPATPSGDALLPDATVTTMAQQYLAGDPSVLTNLGRGKQGAANIVKLRAEIARQAAARGMDGAQIAATMQDFKMHQQGLNAFARGTQGNTVRSLNVAIDHIDTLQTAAQALQNGNLQLFNRVANTWGRATGSAAPTNFEAVRSIVAAEVVKAITAGNGALADRQDLAHNISTSSSPQQLAGYIAEVRQLMAGQLRGLADQYRSATGRNDFADRLSPRTRHVLGFDRPQGNNGGFRILNVRPK